MGGPDTASDAEKQTSRSTSDKDDEKHSDRESTISAAPTSPLDHVLPPPAAAVVSPQHDDVDLQKRESVVSDDSEKGHANANANQIRPVPSRSSSVYPDAVKVPRRQRRGLLATTTVLAEVTEPTHYSRRNKWFITFQVSIAGAAAPLGSAIILPALSDIAKTFDSTPTVTNLSIAFYMLSMSIFPLWWSSFSETLGRRTVYVTSFALFCVFNVLSAESRSISMFIVMRLLSGGASASVQAVGAGTIADIWEVKERGRAMGIFYLGPLCGPLLAPIIGGALAQGLGWRSCMWFMLIYGVLLELLLIFFLPETLKNRKNLAAAVEAEARLQLGEDNTAIRPALTRTSTRRSVHVKAKKYVTLARRCFLDPLKIILHLRSPAVAITVYYAAATFCGLYILNISVQDTFSKAPYRYPVIIIGLLYIPNSVGYFLASVFGGKWVDSIMHREARKAGRYDDRGKLIFRPEDRMRENIWMAAFMYPAALIWYGWTADKGVNIAAPMIANFFFGIGSMLVFGCATTMLSEFMPTQSSHGIALNNFVRNIFSCVAVIVTVPIINAIGNGWLFTIIGIWCLCSGVVVLWMMRRYGERWRQHAEEARAH